MTGDGYGDASARSDGLVTLDAHGWVVWFARLAYDEATASSTGETGYAVWDRAPDSYNLVVLRDNNDYWDMSPSYLAEISEITPLGATLAARESSAAGGGERVRPALARVPRRHERPRGRLPALSFAYSVRDDFGNASAERAARERQRGRRLLGGDVRRGQRRALRGHEDRRVESHERRGARRAVRPVRLHQPGRRGGAERRRREPQPDAHADALHGMDAALDGVDYITSRRSRSARPTATS